MRIASKIATTVLAVAVFSLQAQAAKRPRKSGAQSAQGETKTAGSEKKASVNLNSTELEAARVALVSADEAKAIAAAELLGRAAGTGSGNGALGVLLDSLALGSAPKVASATLDAIAFFRSPQAVELLTVYAKHRNGDLRLRALIALTEIPGSATTPILLRALGDSSGTVRSVAAAALGKRGEAAAVEPLVALLRKSDEAATTALATLATPDLAAKLADMIGSVRDDLLASTLGGLLMRADLKDEVKVELVKTLGKLPGEMAVAGLAEYVSQPASKPPKPSRVEAEKILEERQ